MKNFKDFAADIRIRKRTICGDTHDEISVENLCSKTKPVEYIGFRAPNDHGADSLGLMNNRVVLLAGRRRHANNIDPRNLERGTNDPFKHSAAFNHPHDLAWKA